jgi:hypothetical protein
MDVRDDGPPDVRSSDGWIYYNIKGGGCGASYDVKCTFKNLL